MSKTHGWDANSIKNYVPSNARNPKELRIAEYHRRRAEIAKNPQANCATWEFIEISNLAHEFEDLIDENGECPIEEITQYVGDDKNEDVYA
jgi:hypothetical protein